MTRFSQWIDGVVTTVTTLVGTEKIPVVSGDPETKAIDVDDLAQVDAFRDRYATLINTDGDIGRVIYVGTIDPDISYTLEPGDVWLDTTP